MKKMMLWINLIAGAALLVCTVLALFLPFRYGGSVYQDALDAQEGWFLVSSDGEFTSEKVNIHDLEFDNDQNAVVGRELKAEDLAGGDLCFISTNTCFRVYMNDELIYDFYPELPWYSGTTYGNAIHEVNIPYFEGTAVLRMEVTSQGNGMWAGFNRAYFRNSAQYIKDLLGDHFWKVVMSFIVFAIGLLLVILALVFEFRSNQRIEAVSIGVVAMILAVWSNSGTYMMEMFISNLGMVRMLNYMTLVLLPFPGLTLILCVVRNLKSKSAWIVGSLVGVNLITHVVALAAGWADYHDLLLITHGGFILTVILGVGEVVLAIRKKRMVSKDQFIVLFTFSIVVVTGIIDLISFYLSKIRLDVAKFTNRTNKSITRLTVEHMLLFLGIQAVC